MSKPEEQKVAQSPERRSPESGAGIQILKTAFIWIKTQKKVKVGGERVKQKMEVKVSSETKPKSGAWIQIMQKENRLKRSKCADTE